VETPAHIIATLQKARCGIELFFKMAEANLKIREVSRRSEKCRQGADILLALINLICCCKMNQTLSATSTSFATA